MNDHDMFKCLSLIHDIKKGRDCDYSGRIYDLIAHPSVFNDQMVIYAGLRSDTDKISSLKLDGIAQKEIGDTKFE